MCLFVCFKNIVVYYINIYLSLFQVLYDVRTAVPWYEHVSASRYPTNAKCSTPTEIMCKIQNPTIFYKRFQISNQDSRFQFIDFTVCIKLSIVNITSY